MKKIVLMLALILVLFGISAGASWFLRQGQLDVAKQSDSSDPHIPKTPNSQETPNTPAAGTPELRPAVRPPFNPEVDSAAQLASNLRSQMDALKTREQQFITRQKTLDLIYQDLRTERAAVDDLRKQLNDELKGLSNKVEFLEKKTGEVDQKRKQLSEQKEEIKQSIVRIEDSEKENVKHLATVYDAMDAEAAAQHLQQMADTGKIDMAAKILNAMRERQAAKVLAQFPDKTTVIQLLDKIKSVERSPGLSKGGQ
jgi:flagellar motility protein MotE (MotC chaperone)